MKCLKKFKSTPAIKLVSITHWESGAWAKYYREGVKEVPIPQEAIKDEYVKRFES